MKTLSKVFQQQKAAITEEWQRKAQPKRVLAVDDDPLVLDLFADITRAWRYELVKAGSVTEALSKLSSPGEFSLALLDVLLVNGSGLDLYKWIVANRPALNVAFLTGYAEEFENKVRGVGPARVFSKFKLGEPSFVEQLMLQVGIERIVPVNLKVASEP